MLRPIADMPPPLSEQLVEPGILENYRPGHGMVIVSGATGSGKSTLIAGMTVAKLADPAGNYDIIEGAAPVEFLLERVRGLNSTMNQTEIPRDLPSFAAFVRGAMRREPTDIIVGECRDSETMDAAIQAAISGHVLTTTIHANNVPLTMQRIASLCPPGERENLISAVAQSLRLIINQRLARSTDGRPYARCASFWCSMPNCAGNSCAQIPPSGPRLQAAPSRRKANPTRWPSPTPCRRAASPRRLRPTNCGRSGDAWLFGGRNISFAREPEMLARNARKSRSCCTVQSKAAHGELRLPRKRRRAMDVEWGASSHGFSGV